MFYTAPVFAAEGALFGCYGLFESSYIGRSDVQPEVFCRGIEGSREVDCWREMRGWRIGVEVCGAKGVTICGDRFVKNKRNDMKKNIFAMAVLAALGGGGMLQAQTIGTEELSRLQESFVLDAPTRAIQNVLGIGQSFITMKFFGQADLLARAEAARVARRELEEAKVKEIPVNQQIEIRKTLEAKLSASTGKTATKQEKKQLPAEKKNAPAQKGKGKQNKSGSDYLGQKK